MELKQMADAAARYNPFDTDGIREVKTAEEYQEAIHYPGIAILDLWAPWCGPCRVMGIVLEFLKKEIPGIIIFKINTEEFPGVLEEFKATMLPTIIGMNGGQVVKKWLGVVDKKELRAWFTSVLYQPEPSFEPSLFSAV